ncbi:hypothetical protein [Sphingobacterium endophyticum]|uniref:hypothetical protein n=1 Tax=Sphingobacterium endophyticum TaxID=2546448 RepID=UPI0012E178EA|nr:hypothetical protein [Sphingobacterium endophyticum]
MNTFFILISVLYFSGSKQITPKLDVTDLIINAMIIGSRDFDADITGEKYVKKPWRIYNKFIDKGSYETVLSYDVPGLALAKEQNFLSVSVNDSISLTSTYDLKGESSFNFVEIQRPYYNFKESAFSTIIWVRDKSWSGGFCIQAYFNIINGKCEFIRGKGFYISDVPY